jgi:hypothetical protein
VTARWLAALAVTLGCGDGAAPGAEALRRDQFAARMAAAEDMLDVWALVSRADVAFDHGFSPIELLAAPPARPTPVRWVGARSLLRVRGAAGRLTMRGRIDVARVFTRPRVTATLDGDELGSQVVAADGTFALAVDVAGRRAGWHDVYLTLSTVAEPWREPASLRIARVEHVGWSPSGAP